MTAVLFLLGSAFLGFIIGRVGHCYLNVWLKNPWWVPHHWIPAVVVMILGFSFIQSPDLSYQATSFGSGLFISDLKDFWKLRFIEPDEEGEKSFWHID